VVGLKGLDGGVQLFAQGAQLVVDLGQGDGAVLLRIALAEHVVIDAVEHEHFHRFTSNAASMRLKSIDTAGLKDVVFLVAA